MTTSNSVATNLRSKRLVPTDATQVNYDSEIARNSVTVYTWNENGKIIDDLISGKMKSTEQDLAFRNKLKAKVSNIQVGDVLCASWGWEQTNIDFYQVLELVGKSTVVFREIAADKTYDSSMSGKCTPILNEFVGETMRKRVGDYGIKINSCSSASKWEGQPKYWSSYA